MFHVKNNVKERKGADRGRNGVEEWKSLNNAGVLSVVVEKHKLVVPSCN